MASIISKVKQAYQLFKHIDLDQINHLALKVDLGAVVHNVSKLDDKQLAQLMKMLSAGGKKDKPLPPIEGDFYHLGHVLTKDERELQLNPDFAVENLN
jgi:glutaryl-CoA dehydrogenase